MKMEGGLNYMIEICNLRNKKPTEPYDIRVDRTSVLGNPFHMKDESERDKVCDEYEEYFHRRLKDCATMQRLIDYYKRKGKLRLFCWCSPKRCHAETIKDYILKCCNDKLL